MRGLAQKRLGVRAAEGDKGFALVQTAFDPGSAESRGDSVGVMGVDSLFEDVPGRRAVKRTGIDIGKTQASGERSGHAAFA